MSHAPRPSRRQAIGLGLGAIGAGAISSGRASAAEPLRLGGADDIETPSRIEAVAPLTPGLQYIGYTGIEFKPYEDTTHYTTTTGELIFTGGTGFMKGVLLPQGSTITEVVFYFRKTAPGTSSFRFDRCSPGTMNGVEFITIANTDTAPVDSTSIQALIQPANVVVDNSTYAYFLTADLAPTTDSLWGARVGYRSPATSFYPVTPGRVYDSRWAVFGGAKIVGGQNRAISVRDRRRISPDDGVVDLVDLVPATARAIAYNITITETVDAGFLAVTPGDATSFGASTINWSQTGQNLANGTVVMVDAAQSIRVFAGGTTHFLIDVLGYYA
jgi:hypothetical protein